MAERMGFEPMKELLLYTLSKRAPSTTRPPLLQINTYKELFINIKKKLIQNFIKDPQYQLFNFLTK
jgi:hypothetical protein